jgi:hypothetical protein
MNGMEGVFTISRRDFEPPYLALYRRGELGRRAVQVLRSLQIVWSARLNMG